MFAPQRTRFRLLGQQVLEIVIPARGIDRVAVDMLHGFGGAENPTFDQRQCYAALARIGKARSRSR